MRTAEEIAEMFRAAFEEVAPGTLISIEVVSDKVEVDVSYEPKPVEAT